MDAHQHNEITKTGGGSSVSLFLGLFLLILAFFIMLVSISTIEETRSQRVMDSLTSTFAELVQPATDATDFLSLHGDVLQPEAFQAVLTDVFTTAVSVAKVDVIAPGRDMRVDLLTRELFEPGSFDVRTGRLPMIDRIVSSLSRNPPDIRFQTMVMIAVPHDPETGSPLEAVGALAEAGAVARLLIERGAPPETVSAGIYLGEAGEMRFDFAIRREDELVVDYGDAVRLEYRPPVDEPAPAETPR